MGMFGSALAKIATPDNLYRLGATLKDIGAGGSDNFQSAQQMLAKQQQEQQKLQLSQRAAGLFGSGRPNLQDPQVQQELMSLVAGGYDPSNQLEVLRATAPPKIEAPPTIEGPDAIRERQPDGTWKIVTTYPTRPNTTPGQVNPQTGKWEWAPGYLESQAALTGARREEVVKRPMPSRGRAGDGKSGSGPKLPTGFILD